MKKIFFLHDGCRHPDFFQQIMGCAKEKYAETEIISDADVIIHFTCGFTKHNPFFFISSLALEYKTRKAGSTVIITGCGIKMYEREILEKLEDAIVVELPDFIPKICSILEVPFKKGEYYLNDANTLTLHIVQGCLKKGGYCYFCKFNYLGIPFKSLLTIEEVVEIVSRYKIKILTLTGPNTTSYGMDFGDHKPKLHLLIKEISKIPSLKWIAVQSIASSGIYQELIDEIQRNEKVYSVNYYFQTGSQTMLNIMNIGSSIETHEKVIKAFSDKVFVTGFLMSHPGEGEQEFRETLEFIEKHNIWYTPVFVFIKSYDTPSADFEQLSNSEFWRHYILVKEKVSKLNHKFLDSLVGTKISAFILNIKSVPNRKIIYAQCLGINACCECELDIDANYEIADRVDIKVTGVKNYGDHLLSGKLEKE